MIRREASGDGSTASLTPERWDRIHEAVQSALQRVPGERDAFLNGIGRHDPDLRREVAALLEAGVEPGPFDSLVERFVAPPPPPPSLPPTIGPYRPVGQIGHGGMGAVFLAERADGAFQQRIAVKLLPAGTPADLHARFLTERQILAGLRHPNIARLLDGGTTEDGRPYLVMEYVEGEPITAFCDRRRLPIDARLRLFLEVCAAIRYAHANLIVHRDIKPSNVLVAASKDGAEGPRVKLLDFGIAKLLDDSDPYGAPRTGTDVRLMTPDFAAPEQILGEPVTTATDVYQLGTLLYELVSGRRPHRATGPGLANLQHIIRLEAPERPSVATRRPRDVSPGAAPPEAIAQARSSTPARLRRALAGDIDTIVVRALQKEPERRYASVEALALDVRRHLGGLPVIARPDTFGYRAVKFVRRNRRAVASGALTAVLLAAAGAQAAVNARRAAVERDRAERAADFMIELFEALEPVQLPGEAILAVEILERGAARVRSELNDQPLLQARLLDVLGTVYQLRGYFAEAEPLLREALAIRSAHLGSDDLDVARSQYTLANLLREADRGAEAEVHLRAAADTYRRRFGGQSPLLARVEIDLALARRAVGDGAGAEALLEEAVRILRADPTADPLDLATAILYLGKVHVERGDVDGAGPLLREAVELRRALFGDVHPTVANALDGLGEAARARADHAGAEAIYRDALDVRRRLFPSDHADVGVSLLNLGSALHAQHRSPEAETYLREALDILRAAHGDDHSLVRVGVATLDSVRTNR